MARMVKRLSNLEIDEVSLVDKPANQHGLVAIAKSYQEDDMTVLVDSAGNEVFEEELEHGDYVYDEAGNEYQYSEDDGDDGGADENDYEDGEDVGKAATAYVRGAMHGPRATLRTRARTSARRARRSAGDYREGLGEYAEQNLRPRARDAKRRAWQAYGSTRGQGVAGARYVNQNRGPLAAAGGVGALGGGYGGYQAGDRRRVGKSLGDEVFESLSKALTDDDRNGVISKAMDMVEQISAQNELLMEQVDALTTDREYEGFTELAKSYEVPADPDDIASLMYRASQYLPEEDVETMDRLFSAYGGVAKGHYDEVGYSGIAESDALAQVYAVANEVISKSGDDVTQEQAITALFAANPAAYDQYEAENRR